MSLFHLPSIIHVPATSYDINWVLRDYISMQFYHRNYIGL